MSYSRHSTSKHQILSPSFSSNQVFQSSSSDQKNNEPNDDEIELYKAIKASEDQFKLENQLKIIESNEIEKAIKISKNKDTRVLPPNNQPETSRRPSRLPPGASYPIEKDYLIEDELLSIAIKLSLQERDHWDSVEALRKLGPPPLPYRRTNTGAGDREGRRVPDVPKENRKVLPITIPPPLPPRKNLVNYDDFEDRYNHHHHHQDLSDEFSDHVSLDSDDESNSFDDLSIHSSHYNPLDSTTNLLNQRSFVKEEKDADQHQLEDLSSDEERNQDFLPTRKSSLQDSFVTAIDEIDRDSVLDHHSVHQASSFGSQRDNESRLPIYQKPKIPNKFIDSSDTVHQLDVVDQGFRTPNTSFDSSDTIHQVPVDDQDARTPTGISNSSHSIHQLEVDDPEGPSINRLSAQPDPIQQLGINTEEARTPKQDSSDPLDEIHELENNLNETHANQGDEPSEEIMNSIQSIAKIKYIKQEPEGTDGELTTRNEEIDVESCHESLKVSDSQSLWIETKTCSDLLKWLMW
ncbi:uncharacterized protein MELLADRAFT_92885 [Melampsora larici-populina 98AG31]|uniref:Uncharacterized protein n=1 Tax=Melampsora larici-populina (strain 98AG31 / pathotype 3-4-7) TaxID=747676 RepID=F4S346_MELLP|nr:uncharacterized protein MELLADRAFT_92885 [Melampsora larici-populina 98AG31]EGG00973.1 hypothetical protein MELLADRAFT_92885 [Melampsora larici-populina 98AG31]